MSQRRVMDTNLVVRHLVQDHEEHAGIAKKLFDACGRGELTVLLLPAVLAECVFVLDSFYHRSREEVAKALRTLITSPGVEVRDTTVYLDALERYEKTKCHFVDCIIAAAAVADSMSVATFDQDFRRFPDVKVQID